MASENQLTLLAGNLPPSANVLFMVCSANGTACAIERTRNAFAIVPMRGGVLTVANHYRSGKFLSENKGWDSGIIASSKERASSLSAALERLSPRSSLAKVSRTLDEDPVFNDETHQMMAFDPGRGKLLAWSL